MKKDLVIEKSNTLLHALNKQFVQKNKEETVSTIELSQFIKDNQDSMKELLIQVFKDGAVMKEHNVSAETYYNRKFGKIEDYVRLYVPVRATYNWIKRSGRYSSDSLEVSTNIGFFKTMTSQNLLRYKNGNEGKLFDGTIVFGYDNPFSKIINYEYVSNELLFAFLDIIKDNRILPIKNKKLIKRFVKVYEKFIELGIGENYKTRYHKPKEKNAYYSSEYHVLELLDSISGEKSSDNRHDNDKLYFWVNALGKIKFENSFETNKFFPRDQKSDGRHLWGLQTNSREQDKKTIDSITLTENDVKMLEERLKLVTSADKSKLTYSDYRKYPVEFAEHDNSNERKNYEPVEIQIDIENYSSEEFIKGNSFGWLLNEWDSKNYTTKETKAKELYAANVEKFNALQYKIVLCNTDSNESENYGRLITKNGKFEKVEYGYFFNHSNRYDDNKYPHTGKPAYLSVCDKFDNLLHNKIWSKIVCGNSFDLFSRYGNSMNALNYSNEFVITTYPVVKVENTYYNLTKDGNLDQWCNIVGDNPETFHIDMDDPEKQLPFTVMLDHIIKNGGKCTLMYLLVKSSIRHYIIDNRKV